MDTNQWLWRDGNDGRFENDGHYFPKNCGPWREFNENDTCGTDGSPDGNRNLNYKPGNYNPNFVNRNFTPTFRNANYNPAFRNGNYNPSFRNGNFNPCFGNRNCNPPRVRNANYNPAFRNGNFNPSFRNANCNPLLQRDDLGSTFEQAVISNSNPLFLNADYLELEGEEE
ncbi:hypothetical protein JTE90_017464 [Oedothorax gibbosus]|uniref:GATA zinc finger domain-containing protein 14-like n=1 Tax=Oedothorax gibbosus TaxID=931172 RepID=A0AAV6U0Y2_9ARAC|nr:hypothetical protein JTE90_017464 [Oedothorax gibbosus]